MLLNKNALLFAGAGREKIEFVYFLSHCLPSSHRTERVKRPAPAGTTAAKVATLECAGKGHSTADETVWLAVNTLGTIP